jgi:RNA polymerase sigma-70 factor, ECF subfamily
VARRRIGTDVLGARRGQAGVNVVDHPTDGTSVAGDLAAWQATFTSEAAFRSFYEETLPRVYGYLYYRCHGDPAVADDLTQATFVEAVRRHRSFEGRSDPVTWVIGIARHKLLDHLRSEMRAERRRLRLIVRELEVDRDAAAWRAVDDREALAAALATLPAAQRLVLILHCADGYPVRDVARELGRSESATESLLTRARAALRTAMGDADDD